MKRYLILILVAGAAPLFSLACDICGCGTGNSYIGILPDFQKHIFGIRYRYNNMLTHVGIGGAATYLTTAERYNTIEAWGGWNLTGNFRVMISAPYNFNEKTNQGITRHKNGPGDVSAYGFYKLLGKRTAVPAKDSGSKLLVQSLWLGGGIKLATGRYNAADKSATGEAANLFQLGTGSYDFNAGVMYDVRLQDAGININANYKINTANKYNYQYGNKFTVNSQLYYKFRTKNNVMIAPGAGVQYETSQTDRDDNVKVTVSGGSLLLGTVGLETALGKFAAGANFQTPLSQSLASSIVKAQNRLMLHVAMAL